MITVDGVKRPEKRANIDKIKDHIGQNVPINPLNFTKGVLGYCGAIRERSSKVNPLQKGDSMIRLVKKNPSLGQTFGKTFYGTSRMNLSS